MRRLPNIFELNAVSITLYYMVFAFLWILLSDQALIWMTENPELISIYQTYKGLFYVSITAIFLYIFIDRSNKKISKDKEIIDQALFAAGMATWSLNLRTNKVKRSKFHHKLFGFSKKPDSWSLKEFYKTIHPEDRKKVRTEIQRTENKEKPQYNIRFRIIRPDGTVRWMRSRGNLGFDHQDNATHIAGVVADITDQKKMEEEYEKEKELFENIFQKIPIMIDITSEDFKAVRVNNAFEEITGWTQEDVKNRNVLDIVYPEPEERERAKKAIEEADGSWHEFETFSKQGEKRIQQWSNVQLSGGNTIGIGLDVTEKRKLERELERDRRELKKVYDNIPTFISLYKEGNKVHRINKYFEDVLGYTSRDFDTAELIFELIPEIDNRRRAVEHLEKADGSWLDFKLTTKSGEVIDTSWTVIPVTENLKMGIGLNTTNFKKKERELEELTARYKNAEKLAEFGHWKRNLKTNESVASDGFYNILEVERDHKNLDYSTLKDIIHPQDLDSFEGAIKGALETGSIDTYYRIIKQKSGEIAHIHELGKVEFDKDGNPLSISGTVQDITEAKRSREKLRESRQLLQKTFESLEESVIILDRETRTILKCNKATQKIFGYSEKELIGSSTRMLHVNESYYEKFDKMGEHDLNETGVFQTEFEMKKKDGSIFYSDHTVTFVKNNKGEVEQVVSVVRDISERKKQEKDLKNRTEFIETTLENLPIGVAVNYFDSGETSLMNKKFSEIYGWPQQVIKDISTFFEKVYPDEAYRNKIREMIMSDIDSKNPERMNWEGIKITTQSGQEKIVNAKNIPLYEQNLMISTVVDVTAQTEAEQRLAESEHNYRLLFQKSPQPMWIYNPDNLKFIEVNSAATEHYGYSRKEFYQMTLMDIRPREDHEALKQELALDKDRPLSNTTEWRHKKKTGEIIIVNVTGSSINYFGNNYRLVLINDITEKKEAEEMVLASLVEGENKERARIAQELHDGLGQYLAAANMNFESVSSSIDKLDDRKKQQFKKGHQLLQYAVNETGQISRNLLPRVVDDYGLALAIEALADNYSGSTDIEIKYYHNTQNLQLPREVQLNLYRIAQEALSNAVKYSEASVIHVQLIKDQLDLILSIDDNGIGFDKESKEFTPGLGLQTIKTRTGALGGEFEFDSKPNKGTFINVVVPIHKNTNGE